MKIDLKKRVFSLSKHDKFFLKMLLILILTLMAVGAIDVIWRFRESLYLQSQTLRFFSV